MRLDSAQTQGLAGEDASAVFGASARDDAQPVTLRLRPAKVRVEKRSLNATRLALATPVTGYDYRTDVRPGRIDLSHPARRRHYPLKRIRSIPMYGMARVGSVLLALALGLCPGNGQGQAADRSSSAEQQRAPAETLKERLSDKASDEQRVNNCKVPKERRGTKPRPEGCPADQASRRAQSQ
jgi:hypothetical protein